MVCTAKKQDKNLFCEESKVPDVFRILPFTWKRGEDLFFHLHKRKLWMNTEVTKKVISHEEGLSSEKPGRWGTKVRENL